MRWVSLFVLCTAINFSSSGIAYAASDGIFHVSDWVGRAYWNQHEKQLDHCSAQLTNADNITIIYSLDRQYTWSIELSSPAWNFIKGASFDVTFVTGNRGYLRQRVIATDAHLVRVQLPDSLTIFGSFRRIFQIDLIAGGLTSHFNLTFNNQVLTALTRCIVRGTSLQSRAAIAAWMKTIGSAAGNNVESSNYKEASALASNIMADVAMPNAANAKPNEIPNSLTGDAIWKVGSILFSVSILTQSEPSKIAELASIIIGADAQKCRGDFFSGAMLDNIKALRVARVYSTCQTLQATTSVYYLVIPRKQGGLYLLATFTSGIEITASGEQTASDFDSKIRSSITMALSK